MRGNGDFSSTAQSVPLSVAINASGSEGTCFTDVSGPTLSICKFVDSGLQVKQGLGSASAAIVVLYTVVQFFHVEFGHCCGQICAITGAIFARIILRERQEVCLCELFGQRFDGVQFEACFLCPALFYVALALVFHPAIAMNC